MENTTRSTLVSEDVAIAASFLSNGKLVAIPTETVYGMAANAFNDEAVKMIFKVKNRPFYDPLIVHSNSVLKFTTWGINIPEKLLPLADALWPGPLTLLVDKPKRFSDLVTAGLPRIAIRIPNHPLALKLLEAIDFPLAAPSANPFGYVSPTKVEHVFGHFSGKIPMILDGGPCTVGIESTIVGLEEGEPVVYRLGGVSTETIERIIGLVHVKQSSSRPEAPGMLIKHYAPPQHVIAVDNQREMDEAWNKESAVICVSLKSPAEATNTFRLSAEFGDEEAARNFYTALRNWENKPEVKQIIIERLPDFGLGRAINDKLKRASS